ncbi:polysaccharide export outer membrane protein [Tranquillimonas rosea]|uniref:Polysaccharide export outer membrane protein n=1 Tax=Tranquillimonas rosea TaxID=641238 RepID=A0A1H9WBT8_9RHOB|nr:polysaccharide biosynthesis/export family protein [Tranquillimonas rosea]SES31370.1 polysaccharide export outer membrane protein [Tranquillimonas rosea]
MGPFATRAVLSSMMAATLVAAGCAKLPRGAAIESEITRPSDSQNPGFAFYRVTRDLLPAVDSWPEPNAEHAQWPIQPQGASGSIIAAGDMVNLQIWDSSDNSLLTSLEQRSVPLTDLTVSPSGRIFVPYVGDVRIAGMGPERAREAIQNQLESISPSAQVVLTVQPGRSNTVDLVSGVQSPGSYPLPDRNYSVLSLLSRGGGVPPSLRNPRVRLQRGAETYMTTVGRLYSEPRYDTVLRGGDQVIVEEDSRYFLSLGAAGKEEIVYFTKDTMTALDAISTIGGITDTRADPEGVLILREYPRSSLAAGVRGPREERVVFSIDLTDADGLFSAKNFEIQPQDVVLATESPVTLARTVVDLIGTGFGLVNRVDG